MIRRLFLCAIGYKCALVTSDDAKKLTQKLFELGVTVFIGRENRRGERRIKYRSGDCSFVEETAEKNGVALKNVKAFGVPEILRKYGKRWGLIFGAVLLFGAVFIADDYVWRIEVSGNENVSAEAITEELEALGFGLGARHKDFDFDVLHNRFLKESDDIAWIAVNMRGSVAYVEVREFLPGEDLSEKKKEGSAANIVATSDGIITQISTFEGAPAVSVGESVKKGQLLISGVVPYEGKYTEFVYAKGEVYAEITKVIEVRIPLTREIKTADGEKKCSYGIKIFGKEIFFDGKGRIDSAFCDTIIMYKNLTVPGCAPLPFEIIKVEYVPYRYVTETVTEEGAAALAYAEFKRVFKDATKDAILLSYETSGLLSVTNDAYVITSTVRVIENIAETKEFDIN